MEQRIEDTLEMADLVGHQHSKTKALSGGWRQRLALGAAILHKPQVLFLDEPTAGVDPISRRAFWDLLYELASQKVSIFVTTHYMDEAEHCHTLAFIQRGEIISYGSPAEIKNQKFNNNILEINPSDVPQILDILDRIKEEGFIEIQEVELFGSQIHVICDDNEKLQLTINKKLQDLGKEPVEMTIIDPTLEDVFIASMKSP